MLWCGICIPLSNNFKILKMMNQYEVPSYLQDALPEMKEVLVKEGVSSNLFDPYKSVQCLTDFTLKIAHEHNIKMLKRCFTAAERLYIKGNEMIKNAIDNVFICSFSELFADYDNRQERIKIQSVMPSYLYSAYVQQVLKSKY
jgi:hypothetical protein